MKFAFAGGAMEVGGSCIYVQLARHGLLLDSGIRQGSGKDPLPDFRTVQELGGIEAILVSHAHMDHTGSLPVISKAYPGAPIFMNAMTLELTRVLLYDSLKIMDRREEEIPHYSREDVEAMLGRVRVVPMLSRFKVAENIHMTLYPAGHIAGACCMLLESEEGTLFYSGDVSAFSQQTIDGARLPRLRPDAAILESTYGNRLHANREAEEMRLIEEVKACLERGGKVLIPAFALGRAQEVLLLLRRAFQNGQLPRVPVHVDGMVRDICLAYRRNPTFLRGPVARRILKGTEPFYTAEIQPVGPMQDRNELLSKPGSCIFVCSSGMLTGGPSVQYAQAIAGQENGAILLTGYQDEESPGRALLALLETEGEERRLSLDGKSIPVRCHVAQVGLSAHGDKSELMGLIDRLSPRHIILVHGDSGAIRELGDALAEDIRRRIYCPRVGEQVEIVLKKRREQLPQRLPFTLGKSQDPQSGDMEGFYEVWQREYPGRALTGEQAAYVWYGREVQDHLPEGKVEALVALMLEGPWFTRNFARMFLLRPCTEEEIRQWKAQREVRMQDIEPEIRDMFPDGLRKIGYYLEKKEAVLSFDFPDAVDAGRIEELSRRLQERFGWHCTLSPSVNFQAAQALLLTLFGTDLQKISYYLEKKAFEGTLSARTEEQEAARARFEALTGWQLRFRGETKSPGASQAEGVPVSPQDPDWTLPPQGTVPAEQNLALSLVDACFAKAPSRPYKKGVKTDGTGRYLELSFITPQAGRRCAQALIDLASQSGMRVHVAQSVNQGQLMARAQELCRCLGIAVDKVPSYLPQAGAVRVETQAPLPRGAVEQFKEETGLALIRR